MLNVKKLQAIRDKILGVTVDPSKYGDLNSVVYLQQILDAVQGVTSTPARVRGNLNEKIYLQKIRNAKLGVADGQFGSLSNSIYLQQIINAFNGITGNSYGNLNENLYLDAWYLSAATAAPTITYLFRDEFTTAHLAPLISPRTCEPGPGTFVIADAANRFSIASDKLTLAGGIVGAAEVTASAALTIAVGRATRFKVTTTDRIAFGMASSTLQVGSTGLYVESVSFIVDASYTTSGEFLFVLRNPGFWVIDIVNNKLLYTSLGAITTAKPTVNTGGLTLQQYNGTCDYVRVADMAAPWNTQFGPATAYSATPANGAVLTMAAEGQADITWTPSVGGTIDVQVRRTDDNNCLIMRADQAGSTIKLFKKETGAETQLATGAKAWTAGTAYRIVTLLEGSNVRIISKPISGGPLVLHHLTVTAFNQAVGGAKVVTADTIADFVAWPRSIAAPNFT